MPPHRRGNRLLKGPQLRHQNREKDRKYPLIAALRKYWGRVEFVAFPIGHAGTTVTTTLEHLIAAFSTVCTIVEQARAIKGATSPARHGPQR
jgi:hypothetical protein